MILNNAENRRQVGENAVGLRPVAPVIAVGLLKCLTKELTTLLSPITIFPAFSRCRGQRLWILGADEDDPLTCLEQG